MDRLVPYNELPALAPDPKDFETISILRALAPASRHLGELNGLCASLPEPNMLINTLVLQESRESSAIENIVTTQDELYQAAVEDEAKEETKEVLCYREALYVGLDRMEYQQNLLMTNTFIEIARAIKQNDAGIRNTPGTALRNAVSGEVMYTPPCCEDILREKLSDLEQFINGPDRVGIDPLIRMALFHYQFEAIHPFADGNGRAGRILNMLYLVQQGLLTQPVLYLSSYIMKNKPEYYRLLRAVTEEKKWEDWVVYILNGVAETARTATARIRQIIDLRNKLEQEMKDTLGASFEYELLRMMFQTPYLKIEFVEKSGLAHRQTASAWFRKLVAAGILETKKISRTTYYINHRLIRILADN